jgi:hypothetical protein
MGRGNAILPAYHIKNAENHAFLTIFEAYIAVLTFR